MPRHWMASAALVAGIAVLPACSGSTNTTATPEKTTATPEKTTATPGGRICAYLGQQQAHVVAATSQADAKTVFTIAVATIASQHADLRSAINAQLDVLTTRNCPAIRSALLAKLGTPTLAKALSVG